MIREPQVPVDYPAKEASQIAIDNDNNLQRILSDPVLLWLLQNQYCCDKIDLYTPTKFVLNLELPRFEVDAALRSATHRSTCANATCRLEPSYVPSH